MSGALDPKVVAWKREATDDPEGFWARAAEQLPWFRKWDRVLDWDAADVPLVRRRPDQPRLQLPRPPRDAGRGGHAALDRRERARRARASSPTPSSRRVEARRRRPARPRHRQGRPRRDLHADLPRGDRADARGRPHRRRSTGRLRRLRRGRAGRAHPPGGRAGRLRRRRHLSQGQGRAAEGDRRRGGRAGAPTRRARRRPAPRRRRTCRCTAGRDLDLGRVPGAGRRPGRDARGDGGERARLHPGDLGHDRQAEAGRAHPRRLPGLHPRAWAKWCSACKPTDVWWSTSDIGWVVGHSYIVYAPLLVGCTTIAYEGALDHPAPRRSTAIVERNHVTGIFTSPTAVRLLMRYGTEPARRARPLVARARRSAPARCSIRRPGSGCRRRSSHDRVPVIDHMWQTETGGPIVGNPYGVGAAADQAGLGRHPAGRHRGRDRDAGGRGAARRARRASSSSSAPSRA